MGLPSLNVKTKKPIFITDIDSKIENFFNRKFIKDNTFKSYACIPLLVKGEVLGTISVFIGYNHKFSTNHENFLNNIGYLTGAIIAKFRLTKNFRKVIQERNEARDEIFSALRFARGDYFLQGVLHQYKNDLLEFNQIFKTILDSHSTAKTQKIVNNQTYYIEEKIQKIQSQFVPETASPININNVIIKVLKCFSDLKNIEIIYDFNKEIPIMEINEAKIKDIIYNLFSNAIKAIQANKKENGIIIVSTSIEILRKIKHVQIKVEDNGVGIRNEFNEKIFARGFTTSKEQGGTGMGLFVTREIINYYGGQIKFESSLGKGTKFFVHIPLKRYLV